MSIGKTKKILGKPTFLKIGQRKAVLESLMGKSMNSLGKEAGLSNATADDWSDNQVENPTRSVKDFLTHHGIRLEWWQTGEGEVFDKKPTYVELPTKKDPAEEVRILIKNLDRMGEMNEFLLRELKSYQDKFGRI